MNFLSQHCPVHVALVLEDIAMLPLPELKELTESLTMEKNVVFGNPSFGYGQWA